MIKKMKNNVFNLNEFLDRLEFGEVQELGKISMVPLMFNKKQKVKYISLAKALKKKRVEIKEVNEGGEVPQLLVVNKGRKKVLLIEGDTLEGAKQNRVLNTSILLKKRSETIIPVSCVESGRWHYNKDHFSESDFAMPFMRKDKINSVTNGMFKHGDKSFYYADQSLVWDNIDKALSLLKINSSTRSFNDITKRTQIKWKDYKDHFKLLPNQRGFIFISNGKVLGMDYVSSPKVFKQVFPKLMESYLLQSVYFEKEGRNRNTKKEFQNAPDFLVALYQAKTYRFKSPGLGYDHRISHKTIAGNILTYKKEVIQFSAF